MLDESIFKPYYSPNERRLQRYLLCSYCRYRIICGDTSNGHLHRIYIMKNKNLTRKEIQQLNEQDAKVKWYLELTIAACLGAALALSFVVAHCMLTTEWTW